MCLQQALALTKYNIFVDHFPHVKCKTFLTHAHTDHTIKLGKKFQGVIFCHKITAMIIAQRFPHFHSRQIRIMRFNRWVIVQREPIVIRVRAIEAFHCDGSAMFLFQWDKQSVLFTGDFRWHQSLHQLDRFAPITTLYYDDTFARFSIALPSYDSTLAQFHKILTEHPRFFIHMRVLGFEMILREAVRLKWISGYAISEPLLKLRPELPFLIPIDPQSRVTLGNRDARKTNDQDIWVIPSITRSMCPAHSSNPLDIWLSFATHASRSEVEKLIKVVQPLQSVPCEFSWTCRFVSK